MIEKWNHFVYDLCEAKNAKIRFFTELSNTFLVFFLNFVRIRSISLNKGSLGN